MKNENVLSKSIQNCSFFEVFNAEEQKQISTTASIQDYNKGEYIFTISQRATHFYLVNSGALMLRLKSRKVKKYSAGEIFGEVSIFRNEYRLGNIRATEDTQLIAFDIKQLFDDTILPIRTQFKLMQQLTNMIIGYFYEDKSMPTRQIIANGESHRVEFKESLNPKNKHFKIQLVKTLSALMNLEGGTLLVGVRDDGSISGINAPNTIVDEFIRSLIDIVNYRLGDYFSSLISFAIDEIEDKRVLRIDCEKSMSPVFYKVEKEEEAFIIRTATRNKTLTRTSDIVKYYQENFNSAV